MNRKKLFIHIPKTGGSSIVRAKHLKDVVFQPDCRMLSLDYLEKLKEYSSKNEASPACGHCRWRDLRDEYKMNYKAFAVVRNPWSKLVSQYLFAQKIFLEGKAHSPILIDDKTTFEEFLSLYDPARPFGWHRTTIGFYNQLDYVTNEEGMIVCDILRFEHFDRDTMKYLNLKTPLVPRNVTGMSKKHYTEFYNDELVELVGEWYRRDIDHWGFEFGK